MTLVAEVLRTPPMEQRALPPVLVLISMVHRPMITTLDCKAFDEPWARKAVRLAIAIGHDAAVDELRNLLDQKVTLPKQMMDRLCVHFRRMTPALWLATSNGLQLRL